MTVGYYAAKVSFAGGEISPRLAARADLAVYPIGAKEITNFLVLPQGGIANRPGTRKIAQNADLDGARLVPFSAGAGANYCLVFKTDQTVDVYGADGEYAASMEGAPYDAGQLGSLRWLQSIDVLYLFNREVPVHKIQRFAPDDWSIGPVTFKNGPYRDINTDPDKKMSLTGTTLTASWDFFEDSMTGSLVKLEASVRPASATRYVTAGDPWEFMIFGAGTIETHSNWTGTVKIYRKEPDDPDWPEDPVATWPGDNVNNFGYPVSELDYGVMFKVEVDAGSVIIAYTSGGGIINRSAEITAAGSATEAAVTSGDDVQNDVEPTDAWAMGAFSEWAGYPAVGIFHQERLVLANTPSNPQTIWMSKSASWEDFGTSIPAADSDGISVTLAARQRNEVHGFSSREDLLVFTDNGEWTARAGQKTDVITPSSVVITPSTYRGSIFLEPLDIGIDTIFVQAYGRVVRSMGYRLDIDGYNSTDMSILAGHMTEGTRIKRWIYQQEPWSLVWMALENGIALTVTVEQEQQVAAWSRHIFNGPVKDIASAGSGTQDEIFMLIGDPGEHEPGEHEPGDPVSDPGGESGDVPGGARLVMMNHRDDDGGAAPADYLDDGTDAYLCAYESLELEGDAQGSIQGRPKQVSGGTFRLFRSSQMKAGIVNENGSALDVILDAGAPFTGDIYARLPGGMGRQCRLRIEHGSPGPLTVLGYYSQVTIHEN
jgi:hypothetical protein